MRLPQELFDEIIGHLPPGDKPSLRSCSLVAKPWISPSRKTLFQEVDVRADLNLESWLNNISPTNIELLQHVRELVCRMPSARDSVCDQTARIDLLRDYSPSLCQLRRLVLVSGRLPPLPQMGIPFAFQHTLEHLYLRGCRIAISTLITLINYFPNLVCLYLSSARSETDDQPIHPLSRPLRKLSITEPNPQDELGIIDQLLGLRPQCDEISINVWSRPAPLLTQRIINGVGASVKYLNLNGSLERAYKGPGILPWGILNGCRNYRFGEPSDAFELPRTPRA